MNRPRRRLFSFGSFPAISIVAIVQLVGVCWMAGTAGGANILRVGSDQSGANAFTGTITAARAYDRALTDAEVAALAAARPVDSAHATPLSDARLDYDGDYSLEAWVQPGKTGVLDGRIFDRITPGGGDGFLLDFHAGQLRAISGSRTVTQPVSRKAGEWVHVAVVSVAGTPVLYVDGKAVSPRLLPTDAGLFPSNAPAPPLPTTLWWKKPAGGWTAAAPLGNGRLGVMAEGGVSKEVLWLNEDTLWSGEPAPSPDTGGAKALPQIRQLLFDRKFGQAHNLFQQKMFGPYNESYLPLGTLDMVLPLAVRTEDYRRTLDLMTGVFSVTYPAGRGRV